MSLWHSTEGGKALDYLCDLCDSCGEIKPQSHRDHRDNPDHFQSRTRRKHKGKMTLNIHPCTFFVFFVVYFHFIFGMNGRFGGLQFYSCHQG